jgi:flagellar hook assembly protein FlgD
MNAINAGPHTVRIMYSVPRQSDVRLTACALSGKTVATLTQGIQAKGRHELLWNERDDSGSRINNGAYFVILQTGGLTKVCSVKIVR